MVNIPYMDGMDKKFMEKIDRTHGPSLFFCGVNSGRVLQ